MNKRTFSSTGATHFTAFIKLKRSVGFKYKSEEAILLHFDRYLLSKNQSCVSLTKEIIDGWTTKRNNESELTRYIRMVCLLQFLSYLRDCGFEVPLLLLPKYPTSTFIPHIYSHEEIAAIFRACDGMRPGDKDMRSCLISMPCLLRMLYATGIRISEALALQNKDINLHEHYLTLRGTKNTKDRYVPFDVSLATVCCDYLEHRNALPVERINEPDKSFFVTLNGGICYNWSVGKWFRRILIAAKIPINSNGIGPRVHDVRHSMACHSFVKLADEGMDMYCSWPYLSAYLGHQSLRATEQYIRLSEQMYPELLKGAENLYIDILPDITTMKKENL